jgi:hypothetical protein
MLMLFVILFKFIPVAFSPYCGLIVRADSFLSFVIS